MKTVPWTMLVAVLAGFASEDLVLTAIIAGIGVVLGIVFGDSLDAPKRIPTMKVGRHED